MFRHSDFDTPGIELRLYIKKTIIPILVCLFAINTACTNDNKPFKKTTVKKEHTVSDTLNPQLKVLLNKLNDVLQIYSTLSPSNDYSVDSVKIPKRDIDSINVNWPSESEGQISALGLIEYYQVEIFDLLESILANKHIKEYNFQTLKNVDIVISDDNRLFNLILDEKTGGTYRSMLSWIHYRAPNGQIYNYHPYQFSDSNKSGPFNNDGYDSIYIIKTLKGSKYLLKGSALGCSSCIGYHIDLVSFQNSKMVLDFSYSVRTSIHETEQEQGIFYDAKRKQIQVNYYTNPMTADCNCTESDDGESEAATSVDEEGNFNGRPCSCTFSFNGNTFVLNKRLSTKLK